MGGISCSYAQNDAKKETSSESFLTASCCFESNTSHVKALGWLQVRKEQAEQEEAEEGKNSMVSGLPL